MSANPPTPGRPVPPVYEFEPVARAMAARFSLDAALVCAIIEQESNWDTWAVRWEPRFYREYVQHRWGDSREGIFRACSWGLMQVMGETAREHGYLFGLPFLIEPYTGCVWGCSILRRMLDERGGNVRKALVVWNGGANVNYGDEVLARMAKYQDTAEVSPGDTGAAPTS